MMTDDKSQAIVDAILSYILSEREKLNLLAPRPNTALADSARDTAYWFSSEEDFEDTILEYLRRRFIELDGNIHSSWFIRLLYAKDIWPIYTSPSEIARDIIEKTDLSQVARIPAIDFLGIGCTFAFFDKSRSVTSVPSGQHDGYGFAVVLAYATDGNYMILDAINQNRKRVGVAPLLISAPLRDMARKFITLSSADEAAESMWNEAEAFGYLEEGLRVRLCYAGGYVKFPNDGASLVTEAEIANIVATQLVREWPVLLRPDWQDIGIATAAKNLPLLGGANFQSEFVVGWKIPFDAPRPANFPPPIDIDSERRPDTLAGEAELEVLLGPRYQDPAPQPRRRRWWPFGS